MKKLILTISIFISATMILFAQEPNREKLSNKAVLEMKNFGFSDDLIKTKINANDPDFDISNEAISKLKSEGLSEQVIGLMIEKQTAYQYLIDNTFFLTSLEFVDDKILINQSIELKKGDYLQVYLPYNYSKEFLSIEPKTGLLSIKNIGKVADIVGTGALAVGLGSNNINTTIGALDVFSKTQSVAYGVDALEKINSLPISKNAKKIAGKTFEITHIELDKEGTVRVEGLIDKKKYTSDISTGLILGELRIQK